jgi:hypothetical protein
MATVERAPYTDLPLELRKRLAHTCSVGETLAAIPDGWGKRGGVWTQSNAEKAFLDASVAVWREIDRLRAEPGGYRGLDQSTDLRRRERAAWEKYRAVLDRGQA